MAMPERSVSAKIPPVGQGSAAGYREQLQKLSDAVTQQRAVFDTAGRFPMTSFANLPQSASSDSGYRRPLGGAELSALDFMDVVEKAAALDGAIGWLVGNGGGMARTGAFLQFQSAQEIFSDPEAFVVSGTAAVGRAVRVAGATA